MVYVPTSEGRSCLSASSLHRYSVLLHACPTVAEGCEAARAEPMLVCSFTIPDVHGAPLVSPCAEGETDAQALLGALGLHHLEVAGRVEVRHDVVPPGCIVL